MNAAAQLLHLGFGESAAHLRTHRDAIMGQHLEATRYDAFALSCSKERIEVVCGLLFCRSFCHRLLF
jgi:hypothetical protein